jgi:hypothetical protein
MKSYHGERKMSTAADNLAMIKKPELVDGIYEIRERVL